MWFITPSVRIALGEMMSWRSSVKNSRQEPTPPNGSLPQSIRHGAFWGCAPAPLAKLDLIDWLIDWCTSSETDFSHRRWYHIARLWLLCYVIGCMIQQPIRTLSYSSRLSGWNVRCNAESCPNETFILCCYHYWDRHSHPTVMLIRNPRMTSFP